MAPVHGGYDAGVVGTPVRDIGDPDLLRARLAAIVDSSDDAIVSKTLDGIITSWNRGAERLFGYTAAEAVGHHIFLIVPHDRRTEEEEVLARLRRGEKIDHFETERQTKDGRRMTISLTVSPIRDATGTIVGASKVGRDVTERIQAQQALRRAHEELEDRIRERTAELVEANEALRQEIALRRQVEHERERLFTRLVLAQEDERRRIARELHDQLGQQITALRMTLETLGAFAAARAEFRGQIETLQELAKQLDQDVAFRVWELRSAALEGLGLAAALTEYAGNWSKRSGIRTELHIARRTGQLTPEMETTLYRFAQEALNNVVKHAHADRVDIVLDYVGDQASLIVEDNGIGFDPSRVQTPGQGFGLIGLRERAALAGAEFQIESAPGRGTTLILRVPVTTPVIKGR
jgi:two-component system sensor histidine kinase UhpB